ncbi:MAG: ABC transporter substrate-binding protein [Desulfobacteraceae bacterium]|uniref:ABC transporter substrate-binding protein n=1 Tax=Candidatus Desulfacyla euxinica TaxID=2841693 RepID=A0A8J6T5D5_9DELT|nr:ABC transporter substrate-binding protein [Candidatus Desulfacyla euxinica]MBL6978468.1 ABC transporter substrate-binding protein [Desulfobacteraceae bacterium]
MKRKMSVFCLVFLMAVAIIGPDLTWAEDPKEIKIGATIALSGRFKGIVGTFKTLGNEWAGLINERGGIYVKEYGKKLPIKFEIYDDASKPENARKYYEKMATDPSISFFMGPFSSFISNAATTVAGKHKIPMQMVCANDAVLFEKPNYWRVGVLVPAEDEWERLVPIYKKKGGVKTFATITMDTLHNKGAIKGFEEDLKKNGFEVVYSVVAPPPTKNFAPMIIKLRKAKPDVVCIEALSPAFTIGFLKQMREAGYKPKEIIVGHVTKHVIDALGPYAENITGLAYYYDGDTQDHKDFLEILRRSGFTWGEYMESGIRFWAYTRIKQAIEKAGTLDRKKIMDTLWNMKTKIMGLDSFVTPEGYGALGAWPCQVQGGKFVSIWPLDKAVKLHNYR